MDFNNNEVGKALGQVLTLQYDYPPNGEGSVGYKGNNLYRFRMEDVEEISRFLGKRTSDNNKVC